MKLTLEVDLPDQVAAHVQAIQEVEPDFLSRVIEYGCTRREVYLELHQLQEQMKEDMREHVFTEEERRLLAERDSLGPDE